MTWPGSVRDATPDDALVCAEIYAPYVTQTCVSFESEPVPTDEMRQRIARSQAAHAWLVAVGEAGVLGYAYATRHRERAAYRFACDVSIYLDPTSTGQGAGRALYSVLLTRLAGLGYRMACAGIALPNAASEGLHQALGFEPIGVYRNIGWKHGRWHDVLWVQRPLASSGSDPAW